MRSWMLIIMGCCFGWQWTHAQTTLSGYIKDAVSGEPIFMATILVTGHPYGANSNAYGYYSLTIPPDFPQDTIVVECTILGYPKQTCTLIKGQSQQFNFDLQADTFETKTVEIVADRGGQNKVSDAQMSSMRIPIKDIRKIPCLGGETDIIKIIQLMPGVQKGGEGSTGMFVRGGTADQNLVLLDEATIYNIGHLFGFFSVFNSDALHDMTMIKGAFPGEYGGRLSSIMDVRMKEGHQQKLHGAGGIGLLSSRFTLEGPIEKDTSSFMIAARRTYIDQVFKAVGQFLPYYFYDLNLKANRWMGEKDRLFFSSYLGKDILQFNESEVETEENDSTQTSPFGFGFKLGNFSNTLRWNHIYNDKTFSNISLIHTKFNYDIRGNFDANNVLIRSDVRDIGIKVDYDYFKASDKKFKYGGQVTQHFFRPNVVSTSGLIADYLKTREGERLISYEYALYGAYEKDFRGGLWKLNTGLRWSGSLVKAASYNGLEPRIAVRYMLNEFSSLKFGYSRMKQYMHLVSSSSVALPTDLWYPVTSGIRPQKSDQVVLAYNHWFAKPKLQFEAEIYFKQMDELIEYREGANLILNDNFERELIQGSGQSYGLELLLQRTSGRLNGWVAYTLSWATRHFDELNDGQVFWAKYDRRHNINVVINYEISKRWDVSAVWVYASGSRFTAQVGQYLVPNATFTGVDLVPIYSERNAISMSPSHRMDLNFILKPRPNKKRKFKSEWHFGCYNLYNQTTPFRIQIRPNTNGTIGYHYEQPGLFGFIPSIAYNFTF
jgi:hypothetical protein